MIGRGPTCRVIYLAYVRKGLGYYSKHYVCDYVAKRYFICVAERYAIFVAKNVLSF